MRKKFIILVLALMLLVVAIVHAFAATNACPPPFLSLTKARGAPFDSKDRNMDGVICQITVGSGSPFHIIKIDNNLLPEG